MLSCLLPSPLQFISSTEIAVSKDYSLDIFFDKSPGPRVPHPWRAEPGPLKIVAIDNGGQHGRVELNPEAGGVVVATVLSDVSIQPNEGLHVYQSTKQIHVAVSGNDNDIQASSFFGCDHVVPFHVGLQGSGDSFAPYLLQVLVVFFRETEEKSVRILVGFLP